MKVSYICFRSDTLLVFDQGDQQSKLVHQLELKVNNECQVDLSLMRSQLKMFCLFSTSMDN